MATSNSAKIPVLIAQGTLYAAIPAAQVKSRIDVSVGAATAPLQPSDMDPLSAYSLDRRVRWDTTDIGDNVTSVPAETVAGEHYAVWVNTLTDWAMTGTQTVQVMINQRDTPPPAGIQP